MTTVYRTTRRDLAPDLCPDVQIKSVPETGKYFLTCIIWFQILQNRSSGWDWSALERNWVRQIFISNVTLEPSHNPILRILLKRLLEFSSFVCTECSSKSTFLNSGFKVHSNTIDCNLCYKNRSYRIC